MAIEIIDDMNKMISVLSFIASQAISKMFFDFGVGIRFDPKILRLLLNSSSDRGNPFVGSTPTRLQRP